MLGSSGSVIWDKHSSGHSASCHTLSPEDVNLVLQDFDKLVKANDSTSLLTTRANLGVKKTRAMALWCEARGFRTSIVERRFAANFRVAGDEPSVALCGVDNALARADLEDVGFSRVIEAGLGAGTQEYLAFQVHTFPGLPNREAPLGEWTYIIRMGIVLPIIRRTAH